MSISSIRRPAIYLLQNRCRFVAKEQFYSIKRYEKYARKNSQQWIFFALQRKVNVWVFLVVKS